jgi:hypothetical protein
MRQSTISLAVDRAVDHARRRGGTPSCQRRGHRVETPVLIWLAQVAEQADGLGSV